MKRVLSFVLTLAMIFSLGTSLTFAASTEKAEATSMKIAGMEGTVTIQNAKGKAVAAKDDTRLLSGYTIGTGTSSYCYISLDDSKAIKLDQNTKVSIEKSGKKIELTLKSGQLFFDVNEKLKGTSP